MGFVVSAYVPGWNADCNFLSIAAVVVSSNNEGGWSSHPLKIIGISGCSICELYE